MPIEFRDGPVQPGLVARVRRPAPSAHGVDDRAERGLDAAAARALVRFPPRADELPQRALGGVGEVIEVDLDDAAGGDAGLTGLAPPVLDAPGDALVVGPLPQGVAGGQDDRDRCSPIADEPAEERAEPAVGRGGESAGDDDDAGRGVERGQLVAHAAPVLAPVDEAQVYPAHRVDRRRPG